MTSEGLGEMFEGDSADTCAEFFLLMSMGAKRRVSRAQTRERGPHRRERKFLFSLSSAWITFLQKGVVLGFAKAFNSHKNRIQRSRVILSAKNEMARKLIRKIVQSFFAFHSWTCAPNNFCWCRWGLSRYS
jgi:hypothetical protein